jgi:hypothetical protein
MLATNVVAPGQPICSALGVIPRRPAQALLNATAAELLHVVALDARPAAALQSPGMPLNLGMSFTVSVPVDARLSVPLGIGNEFTGRIDTF